MEINVPKISYALITGKGRTAESLARKKPIIQIVEKPILQPSTFLVCLT